MHAITQLAKNGECDVIVGDVFLPSSLLNSQSEKEENES